MILIHGKVPLAVAIDESYIRVMYIPSQPTNIGKEFTNDSDDDDDDDESSNATATANDNNSLVANRIQKLISMEVEVRRTLILY